MPHNSTGAIPQSPTTTAAHLHTHPTPTDLVGRADPTDRAERAEPRSPATTAASLHTRLTPTDPAGRADPTDCADRDEPRSPATTAADVRTRPTRTDPADCADPTDRGDPSDRVEPTNPTGLTGATDRVATTDHRAPADGPAPADRAGSANRAGRGRRMGRGDRGAVTAELALALPVLVSLLLLGIWSIGLVVLNIRCIDAARDVARAVARGEPPEQAKAIGHRTVPNGTITVARNASDIHVTVTALPTHKPPLLSLLTPKQVAATATLQAEPETP